MVTTSARHLFKFLCRRLMRLDINPNDSDRRLVEGHCINDAHGCYETNVVVMLSRGCARIEFVVMLSRGCARTEANPTRPWRLTTQLESISIAAEFAAHWRNRVQQRAMDGNVEHSVIIKVASLMRHSSNIVCNPFDQCRATHLSRSHKPAAVIVLYYA